MRRDGDLKTWSNKAVPQAMVEGLEVLEDM
jgi:hypothetical protein